MRWSYLLLVVSILSSAPAADALKFAGGDMVSIDSPIADDLFVGGKVVRINAPVDSAFIAGGEVTISGPIKGDLVVAGGVVDLSSDVGGKVVAAGGTVNLSGGVARNVVIAGGQVRILPSANIGMDAAIAGADVYHAGDVAGTLWVSAGDFEDEGTAGMVKFSIWERDEDPFRPDQFITTFSLLMILGFLLVGVSSLRLFPEVYYAVDRAVMRSPASRALLGIGLIAASMILIVISILTLVGIPLGIILLALLVAALLLADLFVSFSLGRRIGSEMKRDMGDLQAFVLGYAVLSILFLIPYLGPILKLLTVSLGFGGIVSALNEGRRRGL
ncbi:hypothetical protein [Candidatus Methanocrinis natronophilus]|uniref:Polymer-forming cytoskeletal protein n=1 Tax=Candidatus Methanocrinis natronophilus TaxID=3033396 RepID=A0ABT5XA16_9EURY|nr:hypothetical protein [Candidatus Methanocrinis natronophilus]MDF0591516.1 hypothetical protein [Candidatus Methanocrinis natronophilus]